MTLAELKALAQAATRWHVVVTFDNHRSFRTEEVAAERVLALIRCVEAADYIADMDVNCSMEADIAAWNNYHDARAALEDDHG